MDNALVVDNDDDDPVITRVTTRTSPRLQQGRELTLAGELTAGGVAVKSIPHVPDAQSVLNEDEDAAFEQETSGATAALLYDIGDDDLDDDDEDDDGATSKKKRKPPAKGKGKAAAKPKGKGKGKAAASQSRVSKRSHGNNVREEALLLPRLYRTAAGR